MTSDLPQPRQLYSRDAEQALIGAALLDSDTVADVEALGLRWQMFFDARHQLIWHCVSSMLEERKPVDMVTVFSELDAIGKERSVGGFGYLAEIAKNTPLTSNAQAYAQAVINYAQEREWLRVCERIRDVFMFQEGLAHRERVGQAQQLVTAMASERKSQTHFTIDEGLTLCIEDLADKHENPGARGLSTGYRHLDHRLGGLQPGDLILIGGRPKMGKTTLAMNIALNVAKEHNRVLVFSMEMSVLKLIRRLLAAEGEVKMGLIKSAKVFDESQSSDRMMAAFSRMKGLPFDIDQQSNMTISELRARALRAHRKAPLDLIVVDYLQLMGSDLKTDNVTYKIGEISRGLKVLAGELDCTVIALSQLNRECDKRANKRPMTSDLRDSGSLEQDADAILLVYRDEVYNENTTWPGQMEVISGALRDGEPGTDYLIFQGQYNKIKDNPDPHRPPVESYDDEFNG